MVGRRGIDVPEGAFVWISSWKLGTDRTGTRLDDLRGKDHRSPPVRWGHPLVARGTQGTIAPPR
jgi:hypothetical protein